MKYIKKIGGYTTEKELEWLYETAKEMDSIVEIGCWMGRSTYALCMGCKGTVYTVDHFKGSNESKGRLKKMIEVHGVDPYKKFLRNTSKFTNLKLLKVSSEEASNSPIIPTLVDMVFIDGEHLYKSVMSDFKLWFPRAKKLFCGHDIAQFGVPQALKDFFGDRYVRITEEMSIWKGFA